MLEKIKHSNTSLFVLLLITKTVFVFHKNKERHPLVRDTSITLTFFFEKNRYLEGVASSGL